MAHTDFRNLGTHGFEAGAKVNFINDDHVFFIREVHDQTVILEDGRTVLLKEVSLC